MEKGVLVSYSNRIKRAWWQLVAPGLIKENRQYAQMCDRHYNELMELNAEKEEMKDELHKERHFWSRMTEGYWHINIGDGVRSVSRIDEKFIMWYERWVTPIQEEFVFEYERSETPKEYEKRAKTYEEEYDERFNQWN